MSLATHPSRRCRLVVALLAALLLAGAGGCREVYYRVLDRVGIEKRDLLVDRVKEARDGQDEAKEQFKTALERMKELTGFDGGELEKVYEKVAAEYERCVDDAEEVRDRVDAVEQVGEDLLDEWKAEMKSMENRELREQSDEMYRLTKRRFELLLAAMRRAERSMDPVLTAYRDQVLFLKHNLNAKAIAALGGTVVDIESDVDELVAQMEASIAEADSFIETITPDA